MLRHHWNDPLEFIAMIGVILYDYRFRLRGHDAQRLIHFIQQSRHEDSQRTVIFINISLSPSTSIFSSPTHSKEQLYL